MKTIPLSTLPKLWSVQLAALGAVILALAPHWPELSALLPAEWLWVGPVLDSVARALAQSRSES